MVYRPMLGVAGFMVFSALASVPGAVDSILLDFGALPGEVQAVVSLAFVLAGMASLAWGIL